MTSLPAAATEPAAAAKPKAPGTTVRDVMTQVVVTLAPHDTLATALSRLRGRGVSGCPVITTEGEVVGVLSEKDIATVLGEDWVRSRPKAIMDLVLGEFPWSAPDALRALRSRLTELTVEQAMTQPAEVVEASAPVAEAAQRMTQRGVNRLPVVEEGRLVGIIARRDLIGNWPTSAP